MTDVKPLSNNEEQRGDSIHAHASMSSGFSGVSQGETGTVERSILRGQLHMIAHSSAPRASRELVPRLAQPGDRASTPCVRRSTSDAS